MNFSKTETFGAFALSKYTVFCQQIVVLERLRPLQSGTESHLCWIQKWSRLQFCHLPQERSPLEPVSWMAQQHIACEDGLSCFGSFCNNIFSSVAIVAAFTLQPGGKQNCCVRL